MYRVDRNNFYGDEKKSTIYTPTHVSKFIFDTVNTQIDGLILDPCVGKGSLLNPFLNGGYDVMGLDIEYQGFKNTKIINYLSLSKSQVEGYKPSLVVINPPFNIDSKNKEYIKHHCGGRPLLPEVFLSKTIDLWGLDIPIVLFSPYGMRLNQSFTSSRWLKFINGTYPEITSIISLPKDVFEGVLFHSEILIFNLPNLKGHYFCEGQSKDKIGNKHNRVI